MILVTGATGLFGTRVVRELVRRGLKPRAMTRSETGAAVLRGIGAEAVLADLEDPESLRRALLGISQVFLVSPMHPNLARREINVVRTAKEAGVERVVKLYGSVRHQGDPLDQMHRAVVASLQESGLSWCLISPNTVMETNLFPLAPMIKAEGVIYASAGAGRIGMVSAEDTARAAGVVLTSDGHDKQNYELTGPEAITFEEIAQSFSRVLGRTMTYQDLSEEELLEGLLEFGYTPERAELEVLCHYRLFRQGAADLVTDTYKQLTGKDPISVETFVRAHQAAFQ